MSTRVNTDTTKVDDQIHERKIASQQQAVDQRRARLAYWMQMGGDVEFQHAPSLAKLQPSGLTLNRTGHTQAAGAATESINRDGIKAQNTQPLAGMGLFSGGIVAGDDKASGEHHFRQQLQKAVLPLAQKLASVPPDDVTAPEHPFMLEENFSPFGSWQARATNKAGATHTAPAGQSQRGLETDFQFPMGSGAFKKLGEFSAVFSSSEQSLVLNAMQRVYERQLSAIGQTAESPEQAATAQLQATNQMAQITASLAPVMDQLAEVTGQHGYGEVGVNPGHLSKAGPKLMQRPEVKKPGPQTITMPERQTLQMPNRQKSSGPESTDSADKVGAVDALSALEKRINDALAGIDPDGAAALANMDIDAVVQMVLMEVAKDSELELRALAEKMQRNNELKRIQRDLMSSYRHSKAQLEDDMRQEFETLKGKGIIGEGVSFEDYKGWRQVCVSEPMRHPQTGELMIDAEGKVIMTPPSLPQPSPPVDLPGFLTSDKTQESVDTSGASGANQGSINAAGPGSEFGITPTQYEMLKSYFSTYAGEQVWDLYPNTPQGLADWLSQSLQLEQATSLDAVNANNDKISAFLAHIPAPDLNGVSEANLAELAPLMDKLDAALDAWRAKSSGANTDALNAAMSELRAFLNERYIAPEDQSGVWAQLQSIYTGMIPQMGWDDAVKVGMEKEKQSIVGPDGEVAVLSAEQLAKWRETQASAEAQLGQADLLNYGLNVEQVDVLQALMQLPGSGFKGDVDTWLAAMGLKPQNDPSFSAEQNAEAIANFMSVLMSGAGGTAQALGLSSTLGAQVKRVGDVQLKLADGALGNNGPIDTDKLSDLIERFDFASEGSVDVDALGMPEEMQGALEKLWLTLPANTRAGYGNDFQAFISALDLKPAEGAANAQKIAEFIRSIPGAMSGPRKTTYSMLLGITAAAQKPINTAKYPFGESTLDALQLLFATVLSAEQRAAFGNDINRWLKEGLGLSDSPDKAAQNLDRLSAYWKTTNPLAQEVMKRGIAGTFDLEEYLEANDAGKMAHNAYVQQLVAQGFVHDPNAAPDAAAASSSNNDPATGDNLVTGQKAQNKPEGHDGRLMSLSELEAFEQDAKDALDGMSEMSELDMLELQLKNDRRQRALETLSAVMKKVANTADGIIQNYK